MSKATTQQVLCGLILLQEQLMDLAQSLAAAVNRAEGQLLKGRGSNSYVNGFQKLHQLQEAA